MTARTTAEVFFQNFVVHYGLPKRIHSDQGANFVGKLMTELCHITKMEKSRTTPYHAMGNGLCERFNRTLLNMLGTLDPDGKRDWKTHVGPLVHAYNSTRQETTGYSPFFLMYGRQPRLPVDLAFGLDIDQHKTKTVCEYTKSLRERLKQAYHIATEATKKAQARQKGYYDLKARATTLETGDRVLVKIVAFDGKHKIADKWEEDVYVILSQPNPAIPVFVVNKENGEEKRRTLHRNLLLPIGSLPLPEVPVPTPKTSKSKVTNPPSGSLTQEPRKDLPKQDESDSDEDDDEEDRLVSAPDTSVSVDASTDRPAEGEVEVVTDAVLDEDQGSVEDVDIPEATGNDAEEEIPPEEAEDDEPPDEAEDESSDDTADETPDQADETLAPEPEVVQDATIGSPADRLTPGHRRRRMLPTPPTRRSGRERTRPSWQTSGDYVMSVSTEPSVDWRSRAEYLSSLIAKGVFVNRSDKASDALVDIVSGKLQ